MFNIKKKCDFWPETFVESTNYLDNPSRGWYQIFTFECNVPFDEKEVIWSLESKESLVLLLIDIGAYGKTEIDVAGTDNIRLILSWFIKHKKSVILRVVYDREGKGTEHEPGSFLLVKRHLEQVTDTIREFGKQIFLFQGLLIGSWGEMHNSRYIAKDKLVILEKVLDAGFACFHGVRSPKFFRWFRNRDEWAGLQFGEKLCIFDDGILGSETNLGTFGGEDCDSQGWEEAWCPEAEYEFLDKLGNFVPVGGEVVFGQDDSVQNSLKTHVDLLKRMHVTYLNCIHDKRLLDMWKVWKWESCDVWNGYSGFDYIGNHMGYRFVVRDIIVRFDKKKLESSFEIVIENVGFASIYEDVELRILLVGNEAKSEVIEGVNLKKLAGGNNYVVRYSTCTSEGVYYLQAVRKCDGRIIKFANISEEDKVKLGVLTIS